MPTCRSVLIWKLHVCSMLWSPRLLAFISVARTPINVARRAACPLSHDLTVCPRLGHFRFLPYICKYYLAVLLRVPCRSIRCYPGLVLVILLPHPYTLRLDPHYCIRTILNQGESLRLRTYLRNLPAAVLSLFTRLNPSSPSGIMRYQRMLWMEGRSAAPLSVSSICIL